MKEQIVNAARKTGAFLARKSPVIALVTGAGLIVAGTVMACKETAKAKEIISAAREDLEAIKAAKEKGELPIYHENEDGEVVEETVEFDEKQYKKTKAVVYIRTGLKLLWNYAPAIALHTLGIAGIGVGFRIISKRLALAMSGLSAMEESFHKYRSRVVEELGEDADYRYFHGIERVVNSEPELDRNGMPKTTKTGEVKMKNTVIDEINPAKVHNLSTVLYDLINFTSTYDNSAECNASTISTVEKFANDELHREGFITLARVLQKLGWNPDIGMPKEALVIGWKYDPTKAKYETRYVPGDPRSGGIHFGHNDPRNPGAMDFMAGREASVWLTFNVDGVIYDAM